MIIKNIQKSYLFTSESVSCGHPDKVCDQISDAILDLFLSKDPVARVACEVMVTTDTVKIAGETRSVADITRQEIENVVRNTIKEIGYEQDGFNWKTVKIENMLHTQSPDIAIGVDANDKGKDEGAGDQGLMFGYACDETEEYMPAAIYYSNRLLENIFNGIKKGELKGLGPDAKAQITLEYKDGKPVFAHTVLVSIQHIEDLSIDKIKEMILPYIKDTLPAKWIKETQKTPVDKKTRILINPTGRFVIGGPVGDTGLTGRKIIVDTYGGYAPHGGGAFSGKDPTKVDRSGAYITRYMAKNIVAAGLAKECLIQVSYAIGMSDPISVYVDTKGTGVFSDDKIQEAIETLVDLKPRSLREILRLNRPIYKKTATYGHFGRKPEIDGSFSWEKTDLVNSLKKFFKI